MTARVSVSLVTWNGRCWLPGCIASMRAQTLGSLELLVVDNGSTDGSGEWLEAALAGTEREAFIRLGRNEGYAAAHERNLIRATGEHVLLLNQDVELDAGFLAAAISELEADPTIGSVQGRIRRLGQPGERLDVLDTTGLVMRRDRRVVSRGQGDIDGPMASQAEDVWGVDGPAPVYRMRAIRDARLPASGGGWETLDTDFFAYKEDVDLAWRLRRLGWRARYVPGALAWHARGASPSLVGHPRRVLAARRGVPDTVKARSWSNHRLMMLKNDTGSAVIRDLPWIWLREIGSLAFAVVADRGVLRGLRLLIAGLPSARRKRRALLARLTDPDRPLGPPIGVSGSGPDRDGDADDPRSFRDG